MGASSFAPTATIQRSRPGEKDSRSSLEPRLHDGHLSSVSARPKFVLQNKATSVVTIERFIIEQERLHPQATGQLSGILYDMALAAKMIANKVRSAGLADILGSAGEENVQGEVQQKLDVFANETIIKAMDHSGRLCGMASEEEASIIPIPEKFRCGKYC